MKYKVSKAQNFHIIMTHPLNLCKNIPMTLKFSEMKKFLVIKKHYILFCFCNGFMWRLLKFIIRKIPETGMRFLKFFEKFFNHR